MPRPELVIRIPVDNTQDIIFEDENGNELQGCPVPKDILNKINASKQHHTATIFWSNPVCWYDSYGKLHCR
ncbi:MAG TPA: hypothetical protein ACFYEC_00995 [Candidatus Brocadiaceae bacterium]